MITNTLTTVEKLLMDSKPSNYDMFSEVRRFDTFYSYTDCRDSYNFSADRLKEINAKINNGDYTEEQRQMFRCGLSIDSSSQAMFSDYFSKEETWSRAYQQLPPISHFFVKSPTLETLNELCRAIQLAELINDNIDAFDEHEDRRFFYTEEFHANSYDVIGKCCSNVRLDALLKTITEYFSIEDFTILSKYCCNIHHSSGYAIKSYKKEDVELSPVVGYKNNYFCVSEWVDKSILLEKDYTRSEVNEHLDKLSKEINLEVRTDRLNLICEITKRTLANV